VNGDETLSSLKWRDTDGKQENQLLDYVEKMKDGSEQR
jgi:hypothetical protein